MENNKLYYSIGEVAAMLDVAPSVLRFWETEFNCLHPVKNKRGTRNYSSRDIELLRRIHYVEDPKMEVINNLQEVRSFLVDLKKQL